MYKLNPSIVMREELEGWGVIFDPDTGDTFGLNNVGVFIWKRLESGLDKATILSELATACEGGLPETAENDFNDFINSLTAKGYLASN